METEFIAKAAAELDSAIQEAETRLRQLNDARAALRPLLGESEVDKKAAGTPATPADAPPATRYSQEDIAENFTPVDPADIFGPSTFVEQVFRKNPDREMTFADIEAALVAMNIDKFDREQVRGAVYYGKRSGWAEPGMRRGRWRLKNASAPDEPGAEVAESSVDSPSDVSDETLGTGGGSDGSVPLPARDEDLL